jgi:hypothetical protein
VVLLMCQGGGMNAIIVELERRADGRLYPVGGQLPVAVRARAIRLVHTLVHRDGLSIRAAQRVMLDQHGLRRSLGILARDLAAFECPECAEPG